MSLSVIILGGGIGGLTAAIALQKLPGVQVTVYEQAPELKEVGATIALGPNGLETLEKLGVENALEDNLSHKSRSNVAPMTYRHWKTGEVLSRDWHHGRVEHRHRTSRFHRAHLHEALQKHVPKDTIRLGRKAEKIDTTGDGVTVTFADGSIVKGDLLIGADGIRSQTRKHFYPDYKLHWSGDIALRTVFPKELLKDTPGDIVDSTHFVGPDRGMFASRMGKDTFAVVGWVHVDEGKVKQDISWDAPSDPQILKSLYKDWHQAPAAIANAAPNIRLYPNESGLPLEHIVFDGKIALVGDAGHPHGGAFAAGGSLAIDDAYALYLSLRQSFLESESTTPNLRGSLAKTLRRYEKTRLRHVNSVIYLSRTLARRRQESRNGGRELSDEAIRALEVSREDPFWIHEHNVEAEFNRQVWEEIHEKVTFQPKL